MSFSQVQATSRTTGTTSISRQFASTPAAGNFLFFAVGWVANSSNDVDVDIADDGGEITWQAAVTSPNEFGAKTKIFYAFNIPTLSSNPTVTVTRQGVVTTRLQGSMEEWTGFGENDPFNVAASNRAGNTISANSGTTATTGEVDALVVAIVQQSTITAGITVETVTPAWTQMWDGVLSGINGRGEADYKVVAAIGTQICRWTFSTNTNYSACIAVFISNNTPSPVRANQIAQTVASQAAPVLRANQIVQSVTTQAAPALRVCQVVQTIIARETATVGVILKLDTDSEKDRNTPFQAYVKTRAIPPAGSVHKLGHVREPILTAAAQDGVTIQVEVDRDHGREVQDSNVLLTPDGTESLVIKKCEGAQEADCAVVQFKIGDAAPIENTWDLHHFLVPGSGDGEK